MTKDSVGSFLLLYASQTGQAKAIAEEIAEKCTQYGLEAKIFCLSMTEKKFWLERESLAVLISSTTGDGEPPDTASKFYRRLHKKTLPNNHLEKLNFTFLGLGDSNYSNFCNCGKMMDKRLAELGAKRFYDSGFADDATGLEVVADPWMDGLFPAIRKFLGIESTVTENAACNIITTSSNSELTNKEIDVEKNRSKTIDDISDKLNNLTVLNDRTTTYINLDQNSPDDVKSTQVGNLHQICLGDSLLGASAEQKQGLVINPSLAGQGDGVDIKASAEITPGKEQQSDVTSGSQGYSNSGVIGDVQLHGLVRSVTPLSESNLSLPLCPAHFIQVEYKLEEIVNLQDIPLQNGCDFPSCSSMVKEVPVVHIAKVTRKDAVKTALKVELDISGCEWSYEPGDAIGVVCPNRNPDVDFLLKRTDVLNKADVCCTLSLISDTKKKNARIPSHFPEVCTLRHLLTNCCDITTVPKKAFLRALVECTNDTSEKRRLQELCSKQGSEDYTKYVRAPGVNVIDILMAFSSCQPSIELLLEQCPRLQPRPYSASSSVLVTPGRFEFIFNILDIPKGEGRGYERTGVCTGWLHLIGEKYFFNTSEKEEELSQNLEKLNVSDGEVQKIPIFLRSNQHFRAPDSLTVPYIMIGPGTGVAPFVGFLRQRNALLLQDVAESNTGEVWLFYGCRHKERDFLYREELENFTANGTLDKCIVSFSRDQQDNLSEQTSDCPTDRRSKYVQENIRKFKEELTSLICDKQARIYVCGDAAGMAKSVTEAFIDIFMDCKGMNQKEASNFIMELRIHKRYLEDVWT